MSTSPCLEKARKAIQVSSADAKFQQEWDQREIAREKNDPVIKGMIGEFLSGRTSAAAFNRRANESFESLGLWGFTGTQGMMFFNQLVNNLPEQGRVDDELRTALTVPKSFDEAKQKLDRFTGFLDDQHRKIADKRKAPQTKRALYFVTFWWGMQGSEYPIYWPSFETSLKDFGCYSFDSEQSYSDNYRRYADVLSELRKLLDVPTDELELTLFHHYRRPSTPPPPPSQPQPQTNETFEEIRKLLTMKQQLIFYGPPGTGKTYTALEFAKSLGPDTPCKVVQFHHSYAYEDFVIGLRPNTEGGVVSYPPTPGKFMEFCDKVRGSNNYAVFIIDEINRGNIPKIFGELLYALEDRANRKVDLPFVEEPWSIPTNVVIIGTMNTADRSIALLDVALRRRFVFLEFTPDSDVLRTFLSTHASQPDLVELVPKTMDGMNNRLTQQLDRNHQIGHTYFMKDGLDWVALQRIFYNEIIPLLEEFFYDDYTRIASIIGDAFFTPVSAGDRRLREIVELPEQDFKSAISAIAEASG